MRSLTNVLGSSTLGQRTTFFLLGSIFSLIGVLIASVAPKGSVWIDHLNSGRLLLAGHVPENPTYPIWGYSLLAALFYDQLVWIQAAAAVAVSTWWFALISRSNSNAGFKRSNGYPVLIAVGLTPWFFLATTYYSNSITIILALLATCILWQADASKGGLKMIALCGLVLGLAANIRSEFVVISFLLATCILIYGWKVKRCGFVNSLVRAFVLVLVVLLAMIPWAIFSHHATGEFRIKSTNSGAVAYLGLGSLPNNPWRILPKDEYVDKMALEQVGSKSAWTPSADKFFSQLYKDAIRQEPDAFLKRVINGWRVMVLQGLYFPSLRQLFFPDARDELLAGLAVERIRARLSLGVDLYAADRARKAGVDLLQIETRHIVVVAFEVILRILGVLLLVGLLGMFFFTFFKRWPYRFSGWVAGTFVILTFFVAGFIQTSPRHSTLLLPIVLGALLMSQQADNFKSTEMH